MKKSRFTLLELITVMVVIIILFGIGAAALTGLTTKKGPEGGVRVLTRMIELTRQHAIAQNTRVALMIPMGAGNYAAFTEAMPEPTDIGRKPDNSNADTPGIIVRPAIVNSDKTFNRWVEDSEWIVLPPGTYFCASSGVVDITFTETESKAVINNGTVKALVFKPNGSLAYSTDDAKVTVKPYSSSTGGSNYDPGSAHRYGITVNWLTGAIMTVVDTDASYEAAFGQY